MIKFMGMRADYSDFASDALVLFSPDGNEPFAVLPLDTSRVNHSPTGFNWGYGGSGPAQLAYAIMHKFFTAIGHNYDTAHEKAVEVYGRFKNDFVAGWGSTWEIDGNTIVRWLAELP